MSIGDIFAQAWNFRDLLSYLPPWVARYWLPLLLLLAIVPTAYYRFYDKSHREAYLVRQERVARLRNLDTEGFRHVAMLPLQTTSATAVEQAEIRAQDAIQQDDGSVIRQVAIIYPDSVSRFSYALMAGHSVWQLGSTTSFEGSGDGIVITDALARDYVQALVRESDKIVCIGLASSERATSAENTRLSDDRSINLCRALHNIGYADQTRQETFGLSLGEPPTSANATNASLQRSVIVVGILNSRRLPRPGDIVQALTQLVQIPGAPISQYRRDGGGPKTFAGIARGPLNGRASGSWTEIPNDGSNPFAREVVASP